MRCLIIFGALCAFLVGLADCEWEKTAEECATELKLDKEAMKKLYESETLPENNADLNKLIECDWKKEGTMKANGEVDWDKVNKVLEEEFVKEFGDDPKMSEIITAAVILGAVNECKEKNIKGDSPGQMGARIENCVAKKVTEVAEAAAKNK